MNCDGKIALVAGGGSGIGRAAAGVLIENGATVAVADKNLAGAEETVAGLPAGAAASAFECDITKKENTDALVAAVLEEHGRLDILISTVGGTDVSIFTDETPDYWLHILYLNLIGNMFLTRSALDPMMAAKSGSIVLTSSDAGRVGQLGETAYSVAKAGVIGFVKSLARESTKFGIRINAVAPGMTDTPAVMPQVGGDVDLIERTIRAVPMKRMGQPEEPARALVFLASDAASYVTGQTLSVNGGLTMND